MTDKILPTVNFTSNPGIDENEFLHETYSEEFRLRSQIASTPGIVDFTGDPATAPFSARPLLVTVSSVNSLTLDLAAGIAITPSNMLINIDAPVSSVPLPDITADRVYVVAVEYVLIDAPTYRVGRYGVPVSIRRERPENQPPGDNRASTLLNAITIATLDDFNNLSIFSADRKSGLVVCAVVTVRSDPTTSALTLSVDSTRATYAFNRPWFSSIDITHRSQVGSGVISDNNPHGTELQDLSSAGLTLYQQLKDLGGVIAKDYIYHGYPGTLCSELITISRIEVDSTGAITTPPGQPPLGGSFYVRLAKLPVRMGSLYFSGTPWNPVPYRWIEGTRILVLGPLEDPSTYPADGLIIEYFSVDALAVLPESPTQGLQTFEVLPPLSGKEFIVSEGLALDTLAQTTISLPAVLGPIKRKYKVLCDGDGALVLSPQPLVPIIKVATTLVGAPPLVINQAPHGGRGVTLTLGLTRALERTIIGAGTFDLDLRVRILGLDDNGASIQEDLVWKASQWQDQPAAPGWLEETPSQFRTTKSKFSFVTSITLTNTTTLPDNSGPDALLSLWANVIDSPVSTELCNVASFFWTGTTGQRLRDERTIATTLSKALDQRRARYPEMLPEGDLQFTKELFDSILDPSLTDPAALLQRIGLERDDDRVLAETYAQFSDVDASGSIFLTTVGAVVDSEIVRIAPGKYLTMVASGADTTQGEVNIGATDIIFKNSIIATINDPSFDSTWFATLGTGATPPVVLTRAESYPEGFATNVRKTITFAASFLSGTFSVTIEGNLIGPVSFAGSNDATILAIVAAINAEEPTTGIRARVFGSSPYSIIMLLGDGDGTDYSVTSPISAGGAPSASITTPATAFSFSQPAGGSLPQEHLPQRYRESSRPWNYLSKPILWTSVGWEASIAINADNPGLISNLDMVSIAPGRSVTAKRGALITVDPTLGEFLVDPGSLANTLTNLANTINYPAFQSGVQAEVSGNTVILRVAGAAAAYIALQAETVPGTWLLTAYGPVGGGPDEAHAIVRAVFPLSVLEWRFLEATGTPRVWSNWFPLVEVSPTTGTLAYGGSLYAIQLRLRGQTADPNSFSIYQYTPTVSAGTLPAIDARLQDVEQELDDARGSTPSLNDRISSVVDSAGVRIQDPELLEARRSSIAVTAGNLRERLDAADAAMRWFTGDMASSSILQPLISVPQPGFLSQILRGPVDANGNSDFLSSLGATLFVGGTVPNPLCLSLAGYGLVYSRTLPLDFTGQGAGTYYIYVEVLGGGDEAGLEIISSITSGASAAGTSLLNDTSANFTAAGVLPGHVLEIPSITYLGSQPFHAVVQSVVSPTQLQIRGTFPSTVALAAAYRILSTREAQPKFSATRVEAPRRLFLGQVAWTGVTFSEVRPYRYLDRYTSAQVSVTAAPNYGPIAFEHNLGRLPSNFVIYFRINTGDADPKVLEIGTEAVVKVTTTTLTVRNRYDSLVARSFAGTIQTTGYLQLVIG